MVYQHFKANFRHRYLLNNVFQNSGKLDMGYGYGSEQAKTKHPKSQRSLEFNTLYICIYVYFIYIMYVLYSTVHISHSRNMYSTSIPYCIPKQQSFIPTAAVLKKVYVGCQRSLGDSHPYTCQCPDMVMLSRDGGFSMGFPHNLMVTLW